MPIYEYRCTECGKRFSRLQLVGANAKDTSCPKCESEKVERLISSFASTSSGPDATCPSASTCPSGFT
jgi:putative FmdB family regulatory protein